MVSRDVNDLHPTLKERWVFLSQLWKKKYPKDPQPFLTCTWRSNDEQQNLYDMGKSLAKPGQSLHNYKPSFAFDVAFKDEQGRVKWGEWEEYFTRFGQMAEAVGLEWGGSWSRFPDPPHIQLPMTWKDAKAGKVPKLKPLPKDDVPKLRLMNAATNTQLGFISGRIVGDKFYCTDLNLSGVDLL
jgi:hypothetical protein